MKNNNIPPPYFLRFFRWFCHPKLRDFIEGDLMELHDERLKTSGKKRADVRFMIDVILLFRPGIIRPAEGYQTLNHYGMYKNYARTGWRNLIKNKMFSFINISGLSLGLTCSILISLWVIDEYSINAFHEDGERIFIVTSCEYSGSEVNGSHDTPGILAEEMKKVLPEVEYACNATGWSSYNTFAVGNKKMKLPGEYAGVDFFKIFSYPLLFGTKETALKTPESIAISRRMATNLFGSPEQAMGQGLLLENYIDLKVTAVFEDLDDNVSQKFLYVLNWDLFIQRHKWADNWDSSGPATYLKLREHTNAEEFSAKIRHFIKNYNPEYSEMERLELGLQPFEEMYLHSNFKNGYIAGGRIEYVQLFKIVAIFILLIASINFMNLSTARSVKRAKEIGVRKVVGAVKAALVHQFMLEAFLFTGIAILFSMFLLQLALPQFNLLTGKNIDTPFTDGKFWIFTAILTFITGTISGSYPAFLLSSFKPVSVLKGTLKVSSASGVFRKGLVVFQFALCILFIVGMIVVSRQVNYIQSKNLGYEKNNLIYLPLSGTVASSFDFFKTEALKQSGVISISRIAQRPVEIENTTGGVEWEGKDPATKPIFTQTAVGYDFIKTMQATLVSGRDFSEDHTDSANYIINEKALAIIGYEDPIGTPFTLWGVKGTIIGVVKDFHFNSLHVPINPLVIRLMKGTSSGAVLVRTDPAKTSAALTGLEALNNKINPDFPFSHQFADEEYGALYTSEQVIKQLSGYFAFLAIFISCLGLLGLVIFTSEQRIKEIGIRKVLGANVSQIIILLTKDFILLVIISIALSVPVAYFTMDEWLSGFEYHIELEWWLFALAAVIAMLVALFTVSYQALRAAVANPVNSLKSE
jgi:ABC-type antimicrobial peptide transport system permease subunit